ncbi:hypothetical protein M405DRAFT_704762, partial [Rhizopogon salebrosus TDB-379]
RSFVTLTFTLPERLTDHLMQLRSQYIPFNIELEKMNPRTARIAYPSSEETVRRPLLDCPQYRRECHQLSNALGRKATRIPFLISFATSMAPNAR